MHVDRQALAQKRNRYERQPKSAPFQSDVFVVWDVATSGARLKPLSIWFTKLDREVQRA